MTTAPTYSELLRDPRWQRKRLEIMQRDDFRCQDCGAKDVTLNVHHGYYEKGKQPWEYPDLTLHTLCEPCHKHLGLLIKALKLEIASLRTFDEHMAALKALQALTSPGKRRFWPWSR